MLVSAGDILESEISNELVFFELEISQISKDKFSEIKKDSSISNYIYAISQKRKTAKYNLTEKEEQMINHKDTHLCVVAEREVLKILEGDCDTPIGVSSSIKDDKIILSVELFSVDGKKRFYLKKSKKIDFAQELGREVGEKLKEQSKGSYKR